MAKTHNLPAFPSKCNVWRGIAAPDIYTVQNTGAPALADQACEMVWLHGGNVQAILNPAQTIGTTCGLLGIYFPVGTDVRGLVDGTTGFDTIECPSGSRRYYNVTDILPVGLGFANEFLLAIVIPVELPTPF